MNSTLEDTIIHTGFKHGRPALNKGSRFNTKLHATKTGKNSLRNAIRMVLAGSILASSTAFADLAARGPVSASHGYPTWYQDKSGLVLDFCDVRTQAELDGGWCLLLPGNTLAPEIFPNSFSEEHFYWAANAGANAAVLNPVDQTPIKVSLVLALEGAFATGPVIQGDQMVFSRVRVTVNPLPYSGDYVVYTPFGRFEYPNQVAGDRLFATVDVGLTPGDFDQALSGQVGRFLLPSATPGGAEVPPLPDLAQNPSADPFYLNLINAGGNTVIPENGKRYIADPGRIGPVTGATCDTVNNPAHCIIDPATNRPAWNTQLNGLQDPNVFTVEGPNGFTYSTTDFTLMGRLNEAPIAGKLVVDRASYTANSTASNDVSVFVSAKGASQGRLPAGNLPVTIPPQLTLFPAPCGNDPAGNLIAPASVSGSQMLSENQLQFKKEANLPGLAPDSVCIEQIAVNAQGNTVTFFSDHTVTDQVLISSAIYDPTSQLISITAASSDTTKPMTLTVAGLGEISQPASATTAGNLSKAILAPPEKIVIVSSEGGINQMQVDTGTLDGVPALPVAANDNVAGLEDTVSLFDVLANDTNVAGGTITITSQPAGGVASVDALTGQIRYAPRLNFFGVDSFTYSVAVGTNTSNTATVIINVAAVNDLPVANSDNVGGVLNVPSTFNLLANDSDPDGAADLKGGQFVTGNAALGIVAGTTFTGNVPVTPTASGTFSFSYKTMDQSGALSANTANVNVNIASSDSPVIARAQFTQKTFRWVIDGTTAVSTGQIITLKYTNGIHKPDGDTRRCTDVPVADRVNAAGHVIGTATVNATNNWTFDTILSPTTGEKNPTNNGNGTTNYWCTTPTQVQGTSSLTNVNTNILGIQLK